MIDTIKNSIKQRIVTYDKVIGVEMLGSSLGGLMRGVTLSQTKSGIVLENIDNEITSLEELLLFAGKDVPIVLALSLETIIHSYTNELDEDKETSLQFLPDANIDEFYVQYTPLEKGKAVSIVRKESIIEILTEFEKNELNLTNLFLGDFEIQELNHLLLKEKEINTGLHVLNFGKDFMITSFNQSSSFDVNQSYRIGDDDLPVTLLNSYAVAFSSMLGLSNGVELPQLFDNRNQLFHYSLFKKAGVFILASLLSILLINTFANFYYKDKNQALQIGLVQTNSAVSELEDLQGQLALQKDLMENTQLNQSSDKSFYADRIGSSISKGVTLTEVIIAPLKGKLKDYREGNILKYDNRKVIIKGESKSSRNYNDWIDILESQPWIQQVNHLMYEDIDLSTGRFSLELMVKNRIIVK